MENSKSNLNVNCSYVGGHITADPEYKMSAGGTAIANITVAINRSYKQGEEWKKEVEFIRVKLFSRLAETANSILKKGDTVLVIGRIHTSSWEDNVGVKKYMTEVVAESLQKVDPKTDMPNKDVSEDNDETDDIPF